MNFEKSSGCVWHDLRRPCRKSECDVCPGDAEILPRGPTFQQDPRHRALDGECVCGAKSCPQCGWAEQSVVERLERISAKARLLSRSMGDCDDWVVALNQISSEIDAVLGVTVGTHIAPEVVMEVVEKHAVTVPFAFLRDLLPVLGMRLRVSVIDKS